MLSSGFFPKKKPLGTMPETPQELENRRSARSDKAEKMTLSIPARKLPSFQFPTEVGLFEIAA
jgi:hypothetical protein